MNNTKGAIHFEITASNDDLIHKLAESREAILNSGKTAEDEGAKIEDMFKRVALAADKTSQMNIAPKALKPFVDVVIKDTDTLRKLNQDILDDQLKLESERLAIMEDSRKKRLEQSDLECRENKAALVKEYEDTVAQYAKLGKAVPKVVKTTYDNRVIANDNARTVRDTAINVDVGKEFKVHQESLTAVYLTEEDKRLAAIKERYDKERKWADAQLKDGNITKEQHVSYTAQIDKSQQYEEFAPLLKKYQTYTDQRKEIEDKFNAEIAALQAKNTDGEYDAQIKRAEKSKKKELSKVDLEETKKDPDFTRLFGNLDNLALSTMKSLQDKIKTWIDGAGQSLSSEDLKSVTEAFDKLDLKIADKDPFTGLKNAMGELKARTKEVAEAQIELDAVNADNTKSTTEVAAAEQKLKTAQDARSVSVTKATKSINSAGKTGKELVGAAGDVMNIMGDLGIKVPDEIAGVVAGVGQMMDGLASIDLKNPMSIVTGAIKVIGGLVKSIASIFNGDNKKEKEIQKLQKQIDVLEVSYHKLDDAISKAYSTDASKMIGQQNEMLEQQKVLIQNQIATEKSKKNTDDAKIKAWQQQLDEIDKTLAVNKEKALDAIFGEDLKAAIEGFANAYAEAWSKGEDRSKSAKDTVRQMMRQMVTESIKAAIQSSEAMEKIRMKLAEFYADEVLSAREQDYIYSMAENLQRELDRQFGWADSLMKDGKSEEEREASSKGMASMSQDSANELNGRFTAIQGMLFDVKNDQIQLLELHRFHLPNLQYLSQLTHLSTISENTAYCRRLEGIESDMSVVKTELQTINLKGLIIRK